MRFLLEKSLITPDQVRKIDNMPTNKKLAFINRFIENLPNYKYFEPAKSVVTQSILRDGFNTSNNKFLQYLTKVRWPLNDYTSDVIYQLIDNGNIKLNSNWLYNKSLYAGNPEDVGYKIKALTYASNSELQKDSSKQITPGVFMDKSGKIKSAEDIKKILSKIKVSDDKTTASVSVQQAIERNFGSRDITKQQNQQMIKNSLIKEIKSDIKLQQKLPNGFENKLAKFDLNSIKDDKIARDTKRSLAAYVLKVLRAKDNEFSTSNNGKDILRVKLGKNNFTTANIIDYVASLVPETERDKIKTTLSTDKGKADLANILSKDYSDTNLGDDVTPLDMLNSALKAKFMTPENSTSDNSKATRTGQEILIADANIKNADELFDFAAESVKDAEDVEPIKKKMFRTWLQTTEGKNNLKKILVKNYQDTLLGTALDDVKSDIADLIMNVNYGPKSKKKS